MQKLAVGYAPVHYPYQENFSNRKINLNVIVGGKVIEI